MRFCVIGTNFVTDWLIAAGKECDGFELVAVCSRDEAHAIEYAKKHGARLAFTSPRQVAASEDIDAVYIASPNAMHCSQTVMMLDSGKHVLCEKPIASNSRELEMMLDAARRNGCVLLEAIRPAFSPNLELIREEIAKVGKIRRVSMTYCQYSSRYDRFSGGEIVNAFDWSLSNASVMDIGVYCVNVLLLLFGYPLSISASCVKLENGFEALGSFIARYDGMLAQVTYSKVNDSRSPFVIEGEDGWVVMSSVQPLAKDGITRIDRRTEEAFVMPSRSREDDMVYEVMAFLNIAESGGASSDRNAQSRAAIRLIDEIRRQNGVVFPSDEY
ncbi:MAG: Gfo/Idh/MocA family oxidoreductase [Oscillospiraceae bacterium]